MYFVAEGHVYDDDQGMATFPAYALDARGQRVPLAPEDEKSLTADFIRDNRGRLPIGDLVASVAASIGITSCMPCKRRQATMNAFGDRLAGAFSPYRW